ncbi:MAG: T9SS type A sorting domain-containing protein [Bacteroidota bacterium]
MIRYLCLIASLFLTTLFCGGDAFAATISSAMPGSGTVASSLEKSNAYFNSFIIRELNDQVLINWEAVEQSNVSHYLIERKINADAYLAIGGINVSRKHKGTTNLRFIDQMKRKKNGLFVYRVKQVMKDGTIHYSPEQSIFRLSPASIHVYPHSDPAYLNLEFSQQSLSSYEVMLMDLSGRVLLRQYVGIGEGIVGRYLLPVSELSQGMYIIRIEDASEAWTQRILIR